MNLSMNFGRVGRVLILLMLATPALGADTGAGRTFAWVPQNMHFFDAPRFSNSPVKEMLEAAIVDGLERRELRLVEDTAGADLLLSYVVALENEASADEVAAFMTRHPDIASDDEAPVKFEQGLMFVKLVDRRTGDKVWDNTVRRLAVLDMEDDERRERLDGLIDTLFSNLP